jgi:DnaK suppressor protein
MLTEHPPSTLPDVELSEGTVRRALTEHLRRREEIIRDLEADASPNVDPIAWATTASTQRTLEQIRAALDRLDAGTYGRCVRCGDAILAARLEVLPYAETCIRCQNALERS